ncbi:Ferric reductase NAD binding domain-containing protein [Madurella fahalii]|uniref:Ferric reductase NAD binding domain-containing protein n=1 Tax=Madurella fahalii TaxID=1157608 RepID=A0ABQ0GEP2_9PEZI
MAGGHYSPAMLAFFAERKVATEFALRIMVAAICGLILIYVIPYWTRRLFARLDTSRGPLRVLARPFVASSRLIRSVLVRKVPGFASAGHALLAAAFFGILVGFSFVRLNGSSISNYAARFGWMAEVAMSITVFLSLKNTPLAFLTPYSYERLNRLHQITGCIMFVFMVLHATIYTVYFNSTGRLKEKYAERGEIAAIVAGFAFATVATSGICRRIWYELFKVVHIPGWIMGVVALGFHQPEWAKNVLIVTLVAAAIWLLDVLLRLCRLGYNSINNEVTLYPLPGGFTRVSMKKGPTGAQPGKHCFLWIPAVRKFQLHPFTCHRASPMEFTVKAQTGFTRELYEYATAHPGATVAVSFDGPYGTFPNPIKFDKIVLVAGGAGATFTIGLVENLLAKMNGESHNKVVFIWSVKQHENISWFSEQLEIFKTHEHSAKIDFALHVTRAQSSPTLGLPNGHDTNESGNDNGSSSESGGSAPVSPAETDLEKKNLTEKDLERAIEARMEHHASGTSKKEATAATTVSWDYLINRGRPDVPSLIRSAVTATPSNQRVLVAGCGPDTLMADVRATAASLMVADGPAVEVHLEQFGW